MWDELYRRHHSELLRYCYGACESRETAEDLAQEVFLKAMQNTDLFEDLGPKQQRAWLYRTVKNLIVDRYRSRVRQDRYIQTLESEPQEEPGFGAAEMGLLLQVLPEPDRAMFQLHFVEGYTAAELGELFQLPAGTVRSKLSRGKGLLKKRLLED